MVDFVELRTYNGDGTMEKVYVNISEIISIEKAKNGCKGCLVCMKNNAMFYIMDSLEHMINRLKTSPRVYALEYAKV